MSPTIVVVFERDRQPGDNQVVRTSRRFHIDIMSNDIEPITREASIVTIGTFDGMHQGHRAVVARARSIADKLNCKAIALTFDPRPELILRPQTALPNIVSLNTRVTDLLKAGMDSVLVVRFSTSLAQLSAEHFVERLSRIVTIATLCVGADFRFGRGKSMDVTSLSSKNVNVDVVPLIGSDIVASKASSTNMRRAIAQGVDRRRALAFA